MKEINLYIRGICKNTNEFSKTKIGSYAVILEYKNKSKIITYTTKNTTSNKMIITGIIDSLKSLKEPCNVKNIYTPAPVGFKSKKSPNIGLIKDFKNIVNLNGHNIKEIISKEK